MPGRDLGSRCRHSSMSARRRRSAGRQPGTRKGLESDTPDTYSCAAAWPAAGIARSARRPARRAAPIQKPARGGWDPPGPLSSLVSGRGRPAQLVRRVRHVTWPVQTPGPQSNLFWHRHATTGLYVQFKLQGDENTCPCFDATYTWQGWATGFACCPCQAAAAISGRGTRVHVSRFLCALPLPDPAGVHSTGSSPTPL